jgi:hypothetical protein
MASTIYYHQDHALFYLFDSTGELDIPMTRNVQIYGWILYYTRDYYYITSPLGDVKRYDICPTNAFISWYERHPHLSVFIRANGIPSHCCTALLSPFANIVPTAPLAYTYTPVSTTVVPSAPSAPSAAAPRRKPTKPHLVSLVLTAAINEKRLCPITFEPITETATCIAPCYHSFDTDSINTWLESHTTCPECRETCME